MIDQKNVETISNWIEKEYGILSEHVFISATHTHSGPSGLDNGDYSFKPTKGILEQVLLLLQQILADLFKEIRPVSAELWQGEISGLYDNRNNSSFPYDDTASILKLVDSSGDPAAIFATFNCHPTVYGPNTRFATADIVGQVRERLGDFYGKRPLVFLGACGDVSNRHYRRTNDYKEVLRVGAEIAKQMYATDFRLIDFKISRCETVKFSLIYQREEFTHMTKEHLESINFQLQRRLNTDQKKLLISEKKILEERLTKEQITIQLDCTILDFGEVEILVLPAEVYSTFGLYLKQCAGRKKLYIMSLTNGYAGYLTEKATYGKYYESIVSPFLKGESEKIIQKIGEKL